MISEVLGLLLGQIAVLSMQRFLKAMPRPWIHKYFHPFIRLFLRCDVPANAIYSNRTQSDSIHVPISSSTWQQFQRNRMKVQVIVDSINQALLKLHNYDKQLIRFEETFVGSAIVLVIISGILLTVLLWLRRLSYVLPHGFPQNLKSYQREYCDLKRKEISQEVSLPKSSTTAEFTSNLDNLGEKAKELAEKLQSNLSVDTSFLESEINLPDNSINLEAQPAVAGLNRFRTTAFNQNGQVNRTKAIAIRNESNAGRSTEMVFNVNRQQHQEACKTNLSDSSDNQNDRQIERKTFGERYIPISLFLSAELLNEDISHPSVKTHPMKTIERKKKRRYTRIV